jgi:DNA-binding transcriptional LysR family regulator
MAVVDIRSLDVAMLRTFEALMAERSVSRAATRLFLGQPAVSASLKRLRGVFDDPLFTRTAHGVEPTARALALAPHVQAVLSELTRLLSAGKDFEPARSDRVFRILGSDHISMRVLPRLSRELYEGGSGVRIRWDPANYGSLELLQRGDADLGLLPALAPPVSLEIERIYDDDYVVVASRGAYLDGISFETFCSMPHVFLGYGSSVLEDAIDAAIKRRGGCRYAQVAVGNFFQMAPLVATGEHIAIFPRQVAIRFAEILEQHPLPFELPGYGLYLCHNARGSADPGVQWLKAKVREILSAD